MANNGSCRMRHGSVAAVAAGLFLLPVSSWAQAVNACDLDQNGAVNVADVQSAVNMALGLAPCTSTVAGAGVCNVVVVQRVTNAFLTGSCLTGNGHSVTLNWTASASANVAGYNVYRGLSSTGPFTKVNTSLIVGTTYTDNSVQAGQSYFYASTAVDTSGIESVFSTPATAVIPTP